LQAPVPETKFVEKAVGRPPLHRGKVRETYDAGDGEHLVMIATDRMSAFDVVFSQGVPYKGEVLTRMSAFWFDKTKSITDNHLVSIDLQDFPGAFRGIEALAGRAMLVRKTVPVMLECVVRGYLAGSGWKDYLATQSVCGHELPPGLKLAGKLPKPIFTPSTKAASGHDENVDEKRGAQIVGTEVFEEVEEKTLSIYSLASEYAAKKGIIVADTKFEFGKLPNNEIILIDEALTPDSSRFWPKTEYKEGISPPSFDKQYLRDWLEQSGWNKQPPAPALPKDVIEVTSQKYREAYERIAGEKFVSMQEQL
jgi:phosphoribosylaminoimidazole-succinocarboxamide synthase